MEKGTAHRCYQQPDDRPLSDLRYESVPITPYLPIFSFTQ